MSLLKIDSLTQRFGGLESQVSEITAPGLYLLQPSIFGGVHAQGAQYRQWAAGRHQCDRHHQGIEHPPRVAQQTPAMGDKAQGNLDYKTGQDQLVEQPQ